MYSRVVTNHAVVFFLLMPPLGSDPGYADHDDVQVSGVLFVYVVVWFFHVGVILHN